MNTIVTNYKINAKITTPCKIVFLSDLHGADPEGIISISRDLSPNIILVGGDTDETFSYYCENILSKLAKIAPCFFALGNHELHDAASREKANKFSHAHLLDNSSWHLPDFGITLGGMPPDFHKDFPQKFSRMHGYKILLSHYPHYYMKYLKNENIDIVLSGHAHGGQWNFFGQGIYAPGQGILPRYTHGMYDGKMVVSRGLGDKTVLPRINNPHEIVLLDLCPIT